MRETPPSSARSSTRSVADSISSLSRPLTRSSRPPLTLQVLHPLQVADRDAAGAAEDVRDHPHASIAAGADPPSGVVGWFASSRTRVARTRSALSPLIERSSAAGASTSHSTPIRSSPSIESACLNPVTLPVCCLCSSTSCGMSPSGFTTAPRESDTATTRYPI